MGQLVLFGGAALLLLSQWGKISQKLTDAKVIDDASKLANQVGLNLDAGRLAIAARMNALQAEQAGVGKEFAALEKASAFEAQRLGLPQGWYATQLPGTVPATTRDGKTGFVPLNLPLYDGATHVDAQGNTVNNAINGYWR